MPRRCSYDQAVIADLLAPGRSVATHSQLTALGMPLSTITHRIGPNGPWQRVLPGVVAGHRGVLTAHEKRLGALLYVGPGAVLTGLSALDEYGVQTARRWRDARVHVLSPHRRQLTSHDFVRVTRTRRPVDAATPRRLPCAPMARALVDACRWLTTLDGVRELVADLVQHHRVTAGQILAEVKQAATQRSALTRAAVREILAGIRSVAEARLREQMRRHGVPEPLWNRTLWTPDGELLGSPDALWAAVGLVVEMDSVAYHLSPRSYQRTQRRQRRLIVWGLVVISVSPAEVLRDPGAVCRDILAKLALMEPRPLRVRVGEPLAA